MIVPSWSGVMPRSMPHSPAFAGAGAEVGTHGAVDGDGDDDDDGGGYLTQ
jgi:hypothetical protein